MKILFFSMLILVTQTNLWIIIYATLCLIEKENGIFEENCDLILDQMVIMLIHIEI